MPSFFGVNTGYSHLRIKGGASDDGTLQTSLLEEESADVKLKPMTAASRIVKGDKIETLRAEEM